MSNEDPSLWPLGLHNSLAGRVVATQRYYLPFLGAPPSTAWGGFPRVAPPLAGTTSFSDRRGGSTKPGGSSIAALRISSEAARGLTARAARCTSVCNTVLARPTRLFRRPAPFPTEPYKVSSLVDAAGRIPGGIRCWPAPTARQHLTTSRYTRFTTFVASAPYKRLVNVCRPLDCCHPVSLLAVSCAAWRLGV